MRLSTSPGAAAHKPSSLLSPHAPDDACDCHTRWTVQFGAFARCIRLQQQRRAVYLVRVGLLTPHSGARRDGFDSFDA